MQPAIANDSAQALGFLDTAANAGTDVQVKQEPATEEDDSQDLFAKFTNEDIYDDDNQDSTTHQRTIDHVTPVEVQASYNVPPIKREPETKVSLLPDTTEGVGGVVTVIASTEDASKDSGIMHGQSRCSSTVVTLEAASKIAVPSSSISSETSHPQIPDPHSTATEVVIPTAYLPITAPAEEREGNLLSKHYVKDPQQSAVNPKTATGNDGSHWSPTADSSIGSRRHSSREATISLTGLDLSLNKRLLAQRWLQRPELPGVGPMTAEAVEANPHTLPGPMMIQQQYGQNAPHLAADTQLLQQMVNPSNDSTIGQIWDLNNSQHALNSSYNMNIQYPVFPIRTQCGQAESGCPSSYAPNLYLQHAPQPSYLPTQIYSSHGPMNPQCIAEVREVGNSKGLDDKESLVVRARHGSVTGSRKPDPSTSNGKEGSVIELSSENDEELSGPISWKLPVFEVTYHPAATAADLPMAKVSIPGKVREQVLLTEDHAEQEMRLFLDVFLPAQQALPAQDPEPAHAVINFHTISVMVLEAFEQYEIGDELGRGYGFHGGNTANRALDPASPSDDEPTRNRSATDADVDEIFFAVIDRWRAGLEAGKGTLKLIRGSQEFCDIALDVIHYVKEHGLLQPEPRKRKERSDKGTARGPRAGANVTATKGKSTVKRKADAMDSKAPAKKAAKRTKMTELQSRKKVKAEPKKQKPKPKAKSKSFGITVIDPPKK